MTARYSQKFLRQYASAPTEVQKAFDKQIGFLLENLRHPSLQAKRYDEAPGLWQARVNRNWRFYGGIRRLKDTSTLAAYGSGNQLKVWEMAEVLIIDCGQRRGLGFLGQSDKRRNAELFFSEKNYSDALRHR
jgi:hypothetical protein